MIRRREFLIGGPACILGSSALGKPPAENACILLLLVGGPSQIDTWDPKPAAPSQIRSPWRNIRTNVPGIEVTELFPRMARQADKFTLVRSVYHEAAPIHGTGHHLVQTGALFQSGVERPHVGCATGAHAVLPHRLGNTGSGEAPSGQTGLAPLALREADLRNEPESLRDRYGRNHFGQSCLMARRLVERGTRFVTVNMFHTVFDEMTWDSHGSHPFSPMSAYPDRVAPMFDMAYSALLEDLSGRGLLKTTLVVATGEFGRTPRINPVGGRDHWPQCWTALISGAGIQGGQIYGSSDATASEPRDNPVHASRIAATMAAKLGNALPGIEPLRL